MALTVLRTQAIMVDADLGKPAKGYTAEELEFRARIELELAAARAKGQVLDFTPELPDLD